MRTTLFAFFVLFASLLTATAAMAQCQLATDDPPRGEGDFTAQLDLSMVENIDPYITELPEVPPAFAPLMFQKALTAAREGDYELAAKIYHFMLKVEPQAIELYNLACIYSLMNRPDLATNYIEKAVRGGWTNLDLVDTDADFDNVRNNEEFMAKVAELREQLANRVTAIGEVDYATASTLVPFRVKLPEGYDPAKQYDLVLALHGAQDSADNFSRLWTYFEAPGFILAVPQAPLTVANTFGDPGHFWFTGTPADRPEARQHQFQVNDEYLMGLIDRLKAAYPVRNIFLLGFSQGAVQSYVSGLHNPDTVKGVIAFGGSLNPDLWSDEAIAAGKAVRVFIAHGREDNFELAQGAYDRLKAAGYDVILHPYDGGHYINLTALKTAQAWITGAE